MKMPHANSSAFVLDSPISYHCTKLPPLYVPLITESKEIRGMKYMKTGEGTSSSEKRKEEPRKRKVVL